MKYYKKKNPDKEKNSMFDGMDRYDQTKTSHMMEQLYELNLLYKTNKELDEKKVTVSEPTEKSIIKENENDELYALYVNGKMVLVCQTLLSLIMEVVENYDSPSNDWMITEL